jgi:hypothetical protein
MEPSFLVSYIVFGVTTRAESTSPIIMGSFLRFLFPILWLDMVVTVTMKEMKGMVPLKEIDEPYDEAS